MAIGPFRKFAMLLPDLSEHFLCGYRHFLCGYRTLQNIVAIGPFRTLAIWLPDLSGHLLLKAPLDFRRTRHVYKAVGPLPKTRAPLEGVRLAVGVEIVQVVVPEEKKILKIFIE